jgi:hypothetical protein
MDIGLQEPEHFTSQATANDMALKAYNRALMLTGPGKFLALQFSFKSRKGLTCMLGRMRSRQCQLDSHSWTVRQLDSWTVVQLDSHSHNFSI